MITITSIIRLWRAASPLRSGKRSAIAPVLLGTLLAGGSFTAGAADPPAMKRTQTITLSAGWNAVFLEVEPMNVAPEKVFANLPVDIAAAYFPHEAPTQFVTNPGAELFKGLGWGVWYAESRPDAFLKTLNAIYSQQAYLIHATRAFEWKVDGLAAPGKVTWQPDSFNFSGFSVKKQGSPTFGQFFAASKAHKGQPIYRLVNEVWKKVVTPDAETMRSGEAFWVFSKGGSDYQGPFTAETSDDGMLTLDAGGAVILRNHTDHPVTPHLEHLALDAKPVPLSINVRVLGDLADPIKVVSAKKPASDWSQEMPPMEAGARLGLPFMARTAEMTAFEQVSLLKISTDLGTELWVPVVGRRADLAK